ncbi:MAG: hypothetical protein NT092_05450 [Bacteroidia bacterium]|nr:hypothetical protein [Bacteroidia bacterium]
MKRMVLLILVLSGTANLGSAQKLLDIYKSGPVKLVADEIYGAKNNWESLFNLYYDTITKNVGREEDKKIIVAPDGSVFMSHRNRHEIWKFGPDGNYLKKFGSKGGKQEQFSVMPLIYKVVDDKYLIISGGGGIKFFDLDGNFFKSVTMDYSINDFQPLNNKEVLYEGIVMWKFDVPDSEYFTYKWRHIIVKLNIYSGEKEILYEFFEDGDMLWHKSGDIYSSEIGPTPNKKIYLPNYMIYKRPVFTMFQDGQFMQSNRETGEVKLFSALGKEISSFNLDINPVAITQQDAQDNYEKNKQSLLQTLEKARSMPDLPEDRKQGNIVTQTRSYPDKKLIIKRVEEAMTIIIDRSKNLDGYFPHLPYFSNIITDDEGNLLVFEFTSKEQRESNIFNVIAYDSNGQKLARTSFVCDDYDLSFSDATFVISKGYVYAVAKLKNATGMPLRLVRFKITN